MILRRLLTLIVLVLVGFFPALAQYAMPLDIPIRLSGTFAELRANHFHSGIDMRTQELEGFPVYAIEDGYVSRIFISPQGFGKAVYINHPDGITSVYAHLSKLAEPLLSAASEVQYAKQSFSIDFNLSRDAIRVEKGQMIGWSGNTGGSGGPHLHFELRYSGSQHPVNPQAFGFVVSDTIKPVINAVRIYPLPGKGLVAGESAPLLVNSGSRDTIAVAGSIYLGIDTYDQEEESAGSNGPYQVKLFLDNELWWHVRFDEFSYDESRYVNAFIDYAEYIVNKQRFQLTRRLEYNDLKLYETISADGILLIKDTLVHELRYEVSDYQGNTSSQSMAIKSVKQAIPALLSPKAEQIFATRYEGEFVRDGIRLSIPAKCFYTDTLFFQYSKLAAINGCYGPVYQVHNRTEPVHKTIEIGIDASTVPENLRAKALVVRCNDDGSFSYLSTRMKGHWAYARIREFGSYTLLIDTIPPRIAPLNIADGKDMTSEGQIRMTVSDTQGGVVKHKGTIDGQWVMFEYEPKLNLLFYDFDQHCMPGEHLFKLEVIDDAGNLSVYSATFTH